MVKVPAASSALKEPSITGKAHRAQLSAHWLPPHQPPAPLALTLSCFAGPILLPTHRGAFSPWPLTGPPPRPFLPNPSASSEKVSQLTACPSSGMEAFPPWEVA